MRIGLYGMPSSGKTSILNEIDYFPVYEGRKLIDELNPQFDYCSVSEKNETRCALAMHLNSISDFIMDGHYAFGTEVVFTDKDAELYDVIIYVYVPPEKLRNRMTVSDKNRKYLKYDLCEWQHKEIKELRERCHKDEKDFYVIDTTLVECTADNTDVHAFIQDVIQGYSCVGYARACTKRILSLCVTETIQLFDGDRTLTVEDTSNKVFGYKTDIFDNNFYTGYQIWREYKEFMGYGDIGISKIPVDFNSRITSKIQDDSYVLSSGHSGIWDHISCELGMTCFCGAEMSADTKYHITKFLQLAGKRVIAFGDSMNDYYMLRQADVGYLVAREDGTLSRSLNSVDKEGLIIV